MEAASVPAATTRRRRAKQHKAEPGTPWWMWLAAAAVTIFCLFPFYWLVNTSLKTGPDLSTASLLPPNPTLDNYQSIFNNSAFTTALKNSAIVAFMTTALSLMVIWTSLSILYWLRARQAKRGSDAGKGML